MKQAVKKFVYFKIDKNGLPVNGSNVILNNRPPSAVGSVAVVVDSPTTNNVKEPFPYFQRFFVQADSEGTPIDGTLMNLPYVPEGKYLELFANGILSLPTGSNQNSGAEPDDPEDVAEVPIYMSEQYMADGLVVTQFDGKRPAIKKTCFSFQVQSPGGSSEVSYLDCDGVFVKRTVNNETIFFCALEGSVAVVFGTGVLIKNGLCS